MCEIFTLLGCYTAYIGSYLSTFRDNFKVPYSRIMQSKKARVLSPVSLLGLIDV
jgi:hypothetical protein